MMDLDGLMRPEVIAVYGEKPVPGEWGRMLLENLNRGRFGGTLVSINPGGEEVLGIPGYPTLGAYGKPVDLCFFTVPAEGVPAVLLEALDAGVKAVCVLSTGFKESGGEGAELEKRLNALCSERNVPLLGPNSLGLLNSQHRFNGSLVQRIPLSGGISFFSQSRAVCMAILDWAVWKKIGISKMISVGNKAMLGEDDFLDFFKNDPETGVIIGYLESIEAGASFVRTAEAVSRIKPTILLKAGNTAAGSKATSAHTGNLAGAEVVYESVFKRSGIIRARTFEELCEFALAFLMQPLPGGRRVAVLSNAGGPGVMAADAVEMAGLGMSSLHEYNMEKLASELRLPATPGNPVILQGVTSPDSCRFALEQLLTDERVDAVLVVFAPQPGFDIAAATRALGKIKRGHKPVLASLLGGGEAEKGRRILLEIGIPEFSSPGRAVTSLKAMYNYARWLKRPSRVIKRFAVNRRRVERIISRDIRAGNFYLDQAKAKEILAAYGFRVNPATLVFDVEEAVSVAGRLGYPVVLKIASPDVIHKTEVGGVKLNLTTPQAVRDAYELMMLRLGRKQPQLRITGAYLEKMCLPGREVILGMTRDPRFGPMLMFGLGGIFVEMMKDVTFNIAPITEDEAMRMLESTRSFTLLKGWEEEYSVDLKAIAGGLQRISQLATDFPRIRELDINPFIVGEVGADSHVVDACITLAHPVEPDNREGAER